MTGFNYLVVSMLKSSFICVLSWLTVTIFLETSEVNKHPAYQFTYSASSDLENSVVKVAAIYGLHLAALTGRFPPCWLPQLGQRESVAAVMRPVGRI